jgi:hypothetical protein
LPTEYVHQRTVDDDDDGTAENGHVVDVVDAASEQRGRFDDTHGEAGDLVSIRATVDQENLENPAFRHGAATAAHCEGDAAAYRRAC